MPHSLPVSRWTVTWLDDDDYTRAKDFHWHKSRRGYVAGTVLEDGVRKRVYLHRWLLNAQPGQIVDHIDRDPLNNCRSNLRLATRSQNQANRRRNTTSRSGFKGVSWHKGRGKWVARIQVQGQRLHLGYFDTSLEAAYMYDAYAQTYFGEYARTNLPFGW